MSDYKAKKEAFVSGTTGSSFSHVNIVSSVALSSIALYSTLRTRGILTAKSSLLVEWLLLVLPLLLSTTLFAERPTILFVFLAILSLVIRTIPLKETIHGRSTILDISRPHSPSHAIDVSEDVADRARAAETSPRGTTRVASLPALTTYRAHMMLMTCLSILAVDFPVFPRALAKCETFGVSLMDLGVGSFVFSQGIVSAIPILRDPTYLTIPMTRKFIKTSKKVVPLLLLGIIRVFSVKGTDYPEHESEYGTHWNFFFTLALLPLLEILLHQFVISIPISLLGVLVAVSHQLALSLTSLQRYTLEAPRLGLISANKEGLVSLTGYLAIHLAGLSAGTVILPPSPSDFKRRLALLRKSSSQHVSQAGNNKSSQKAAQRQDGKTVTELFSYAFLWWIFLGLCILLGIGGGVSRRLANLPYVLWVSAYNASFVVGYLLLDMYFYPSPSLTGNGSSETLLIPSQHLASEPALKRCPPALLDAINTNSLFVFLLANIMTGLINMSIATMHASDVSAMAILSAYSMAVCGFAWAVRSRRLWKL